MSRLQDILEEYKRLGIPDQIDYDKLYLYSIITHSTAVEGSTVTEIENQLLFDEGISPDKPIAEQLMNLDLKRAYEEAIVFAKKHEEINVKMLCHLAAIVMKNTGSEYKTIMGNFSSANGDLRLLNVTAGRGGKSYMSFQKVPARLEEFCEWLNVQRKGINTGNVEEIYKLSFLAHYNLVYIHPWADGNGRMSRLIMNMIQVEFGVIPSIVKRDKREEYIKSLAASQDAGDSAIFLEFMVKHHQDNIEEAISEYKESINNDTLNLNNDTLNDTLKLSSKEEAVFDIIRKDNNVLIEMIVSETGFSRPTVTRAISSLKEKNVLGRAGSRKNGHWVIHV